MKADVLLVRKGWQSCRVGSRAAYARGQAHDGGCFADASALALKFAEAAAVQELDALASRLNGCWCAVWLDGDAVYCAADHVRSFQLLYRVNEAEGRVDVFDDLCRYRRAHALELDADCADEYLSSGYVYRSRTLFRGVFSLQAGERVLIEDGVVKPWRYWRYVPNQAEPVAADDALVRRIDHAFLDSMRRLVESVGDRRIVVPLSGGYDSRLIVNYLSKLGFRRVLCYTYGSQGNGESRCSRAVASKLGYEWHQVEQDERSLEKLLEEEDARKYSLFASNGCNRPCYQEFLALRALMGRGLVSPECDVIAPGYYFDVLAGSKISLLVNNRNAASEVCGWENNFFPRGHFNRTVAAIQKVFDQNPDVPAAAYYEGWSWQERLAKFIVNAVRTYEHLGFDFRLPVCDRALFDLWLSLPCSLRFQRRYFKSIFPRLSVAEIRACPVHGAMRSGGLKRLKEWLSGKMSYRMRFHLRRLCRRPEGDVGLARWFCAKEMDRLDVVRRAIPGAASRLSQVASAPPNAIISLMALAAEIDWNGAKSNGAEL